jgi:hypothetical protein
MPRGTLILRVTGLSHAQSRSTGGIFPIRSLAAYFPKIAAGKTPRLDEVPKSGLSGFILWLGQERRINEA